MIEYDRGAGPPRASTAVVPPRLAVRASGMLVALGSIGLLLMVLLLWQISSGLTFVLPTVQGTLDALADNLSSAQYRADLAYTVRNIGVSFAIGASAGALLGMTLGYVAWLRRGLEPFLLALYSVPKIIIYPLLLPILKIGSASQIAMGALHAFFPMMIMVAGAVASMAPVYRKLGRSLGASPVQMFWRITLPAIRRSFLTGMRLGVSLATIGVILAEFFITVEGVGRVMRQAYNFAQYESLMSTVMVLLVLSFAASFLIWTIERRLPEE